MHIPQQVSDRVKEAPAQVLRAVFAGIGQVLLVADRIRSRAAEEERDRAAAAAQPTQPTQPARPAQPRREAAAPARETPAPPRVATRWRSLDETGNVRLLPRDDEAEEEEPPAAPAEPRFVPGPAAEVPAATEVPAAEAEPAADTVEEIPVISEPLAATEVPAAEPDTVEEIPVISEPIAIAEVPSAESAAAAADVAAPPAEPTPPEPTPAEPTPAGQPADAGLRVLPVANYDGLTIASLRARLRNLDPAQLRLLIDYEKAHAGRADVMTMFERRITKLESEA